MLSALLFLFTVPIIVVPAFYIVWNNTVFFSHIKKTNSNKNNNKKQCLYTWYLDLNYKVSVIRCAYTLKSTKLNKFSLTW